MTIDGKAVASDILREVKERIPSGVEPTVRAITLAPSPATESYLRIKVARAAEAGMTMDVVRLPDGCSEDDVCAAISAPGASAVIVQLPLPKEYDTGRIVDCIPLSRDADVLSSASYERFERDELQALIPPVALSVLEVVQRFDIAVKGKQVVVIGAGRLVGRPVATVLRRAGALVTVSVKETPGKEELYRNADIIVSGAGAGHIVTPDLVRDGVVLIDAGTSGAKGAVIGDISPDCASKASLFTPVPGGMGPIAVACLFRNTAQLLERAFAP
jgi:methylenetetrahydrofolate dehydrogenase (NADP+)/methenyltetrahydrofolate cyclohydrolase